MKIFKGKLHKINATLILIIGISYLLLVSYIYISGISFSSKYNAQYDIGIHYYDRITKSDNWGGFSGDKEIKYPSFFKYTDSSLIKYSDGTTEEFITKYNLHDEYNSMNLVIRNWIGNYLPFSIILIIMIFIGLFHKVKIITKSNLDKIQLYSYGIIIIPLIAMNFYFAYLPIFAIILGIMFITTSVILFKNPIKQQ